MTDLEYSTSSPEIGKTLLQAGLWACTGKLFPIAGAGLPAAGADSFRAALMERAVREKMVPMLAAFAEAYDLGLGEAPARLSEVFGIIAREQYTHLKPALDELARRGIPLVIIKGADLDLAVYRRAFPRVMGDIDILVRPPDGPAVVEVFKGLGFQQGVLDKSLLRMVPLTESEIAEKEEGSIELVELAKLVSVPDLLPYREVVERHLAYWRMMPVQGAYYLVVGYDVHTHLALEFEIADVWTGLRTIDFPEVGRCLAQSFTDLSWYLSVRFYHELHLNNAFVMRSFLDVLSTVQHHGETFDWERIYTIADKYELHPALYYTFWHISELLGGAVPQSLLDRLYPSNVKTDRGHDWGDFIPKMLGDVQVSPILAEAPPG